MGGYCLWHHIYDIFLSHFYQKHSNQAFSTLTWSDSLRESSFEWVKCIIHKKGLRTTSQHLVFLWITAIKGFIGMQSENLEHG